MSNVINLMERKAFFDLTNEEPTDFEADIQLIMLDFWGDYYEQLLKNDFGSAMKVLSGYSDRLIDMHEKYR